MHRFARPLCAVLLGAAACAASAQMTPVPSSPPEAVGPWRYSASLYLYVPSLSGKTSFPADSGGTTLEFDVLEHLKFTFMGAVDAHNGQWGAFSDFIYLDFADKRSQTRKFTIGDSDLPAGTTADLHWKLKGTAWTVGGQYRIVNGSTVTLDAIAGARWLDIKRSSDWSITGDIGSLDPASRTGSRKDSTTLLDGILGVRGRASFGPDSAVVGAVLLRHRRRRIEAHLAGRGGPALRVRVGRGERHVARARLRPQVGRPGREGPLQRAAGRRDLALLAAALPQGSFGSTAAGSIATGPGSRSGFASTQVMKIW
jgi:hypothetical protein